MSIRLPTDPELLRHLLASPDDDLGKYFLGLFIEVTAERRGATASQVQAMGNAIVEALRTVETLDVGVSVVPVEKALRLAAIGEFAAAGRIFRTLLNGETIPALIKSLAREGKKFRAGRKSGSIRPVRKFIRSRLKQNHSIKNQEIWDDIRSRPPKGWTPMQNARLGRYIEGPNPGDNVGWPRFRNIAAQERKLLRNSRNSEGVKPR